MIARMLTASDQVIGENLKSTKVRICGTVCSTDGSEIILETKAKVLSPSETCVGWMKN